MDGYVVSYVLNGSKRTLAAFVSRKTRMKLRIYPDHLLSFSAKTGHILQGGLWKEFLFGIL